MNFITQFGENFNKMHSRPVKNNPLTEPVTVTPTQHTQICFTAMQVQGLTQNLLVSFSCIVLNIFVSLQYNNKMFSYKKEAFLLYSNNNVNNTCIK